jgi:hypothetical protein
MGRKENTVVVGEKVVFEALAGPPHASAANKKAEARIAREPALWIMTVFIMSPCFERPAHQRPRAAVAPQQRWLKVAQPRHNDFRSGG